MRLRTAAIDHLLGRAVAQGVQQIVLLGAGLDARAHRLSGLEAVRVFEVDHPASQAYKRHKVERLPNTAAEVVYVPVDFERESLTDRLTACHFDAKSPSFWVWEGVTMYLDPAATDATLRAIAALAAPGSRAIATYMIPEPLGAASPWVHRALAILDEPLRGALTPKHLHDMAREADFQVISDGCNSDWARDMGATGAGWAAFFRSERMVLLERAATAQG